MTFEKFDAWMEAGRDDLLLILREVFGLRKEKFGFYGSERFYWKFLAYLEGEKLRKHSKRCKLTTTHSLFVY
jgi:hypothetical protein